MKYIVEDATHKILAEAASLEDMGRQILEKEIVWDGNLVCVWQMFEGKKCYLPYQDYIYLKKMAGTKDFSIRTR